MQRTLDNYFVKVNSVEETIPREWKENPIPRASVTPKRPVGRPRKRKNDEDAEEITLIREDEAITGLSGASPKRGKYAHYTPKQKREILEEVELCGLRATARKWNITPSTVCTWKKEDPASPRHKSGRIVGGGRTLSYDEETENKIVGWVQTQRDLQLSVSRDSIRRYAMTITKEQFPNFKASEGWLAKFMKRNNLSLRSHTSLSQKLPPDLELRLSVFYKHLKELRTEHELDEDCLIINMDEVPSVFDTVPSKTVHTRGEKDVKVQTTGREKKHFTTVLAVSAAGDYLPTMCIFKGKRELKDLKLPKGWVIQMNEKAWMNEAVMIRWINEILRPYTQCRPCLIVLDSFSAHVTPKVKEQFAKINAYPAVIPGGCSSKAQPLDVALNKPFKDRLRRNWTLFMQERQESSKESMNLKGPTHQDVISWIKQALVDIQTKNIVSKSFKVTGISTALSGSEDHMLHNPDLFDDDDEIDDEFEGYGEEDVYESEDPFYGLD